MSRSDAAALEAALAAFGALRPGCEIDVQREGDSWATAVVFKDGLYGELGEPRIETWHVFASGTAQLVHSSP